MNQNSDTPSPPPAPPGLVTALDLAAQPGQNLNAQGTRNTFSSPQAPKSQEERQVAGEIGERNNPASSPATIFGVTRESRVSMNVPQRKLETPDLPGYHLHWFLRNNVPRAVRAGYEYVSIKELPTMDRSIGGRGSNTNTEELGGGDQITHLDGRDEHGNLVDLVLMKIRLEWYFDDQRKIAERNLSVLQQVFGSKLALRLPGENERDYSSRYTKEAVIDMSNGRFRPRT